MKYVISILMLLVSPHALSGKEHIALDKKIVTISTYETEALVSFSPEFTNTQRCSQGASNLVAIDLTSAAGKHMLSTALAAATAKKDVGFGIEGCLSGHYPKLYRIDVKF